MSCVFPNCKLSVSLPSATLCDFHLKFLYNIRIGIYVNYCKVEKCFNLKYADYDRYTNHHFEYIKSICKFEG